jgi:tetratricopeptide (TPR) repeat protein
MSWVFGLLLGCLATPPAAPGNAADSPVPPSASDPATTTQAIEYRNFTDEELYQAIIGELSAQRGNLREASNTYFKLAFSTRDLSTIRRATQFASASNDLNAMIQLGLLWSEVAPADVNPHLMLSYQLLEAGRFEDAVNHMATIIELGGQIDFSAISRRTLRLDTERRGRLITNLRGLQRIYPDEESIHYTVIELLDQNQQTQEALRELLNLRGIFGEGAQVVLIEAQLLLKLNQDERVRRVLRNGVRDYPQDSQLRFTYARYLIQHDEYNAAKRQFELMLRQNPNDFETIYSIALLDIEMKNYRDAREHLTRLLNVNHRADDSHFYLAYIAEQEENFSEAIRHYRSVEISSNNFLAAQQQATNFAIRLERFDEAHDWLIRQSRGQPRLEVLFASMEASALIQAEEYERARAVIDEALQGHPNNVDLLFTRVLLSDRLNDMVSSERDLRSIITLQPNDSRALNHLGYMLADRTTRFDEARVLIDRAIGISPDDPAIIDSLAWVQYKQGEYEAALQNLRRAYAAFPDHEVASHLGEVLWVMGHQEEALQVWKDALVATPDSELLKEVMERLLP